MVMKKVKVFERHEILKLQTIVVTGGFITDILIDVIYPHLNCAQVKVTGRTDKQLLL